MALINCPECGKEISDKAKNCIHCGYPLDSVNSAPPDITQNTDKILDKTTHINTCPENISKTTTTNNKNSNFKNLFNRYKKLIIACLVGVIAIILIIVFLTKLQLSFEEGNNTINNTQSETQKPKEITREELIAKLGGVLTVSCDEMIKYYELLHESKYYIEGKIEKAEYSTYFKEYEYEIDAGLFDTIKIESKEKFDKGDHIYLSVRGLSRSYADYEVIQISKNKTNAEYLNAEDYYEIYEAQVQTRFIVTGYILNKYGSEYCMYESKEDYTGNIYSDRYILIAFSDEQTNIMGKKIQIMGKLDGAGLYNCSLVSD